MDLTAKRRQQIVLGAFYGDAFSLGPHWIYDVEQIRNQFGVIETMTAPLEGSYHSGKKAGDFTHYGDQSLILLQSVSERRGYSLEDYKKKWLELFDDYAGYIDGATRKTLANVAAGKSDPIGSPSNDLAGAAKIAPLIYCYHELDAVLAAVQEQVAMTHNSELVINTALFFAKLTHSVLAGKGVHSSVEKGLKDLQSDQLKELIDKGVQAKGEETVSALQAFGTACSVGQSLPGTIQIILSFADDFQGGMSANVMAGGDSAARGALIGMVLGAANNVDDSVYQQINAYTKIKELLQNFG